MLLFRDEQEIETWCKHTGEPRGAVVPLQKILELSKVWYGTRMSPAYRGRTQEATEAILAQFGLTGDFWKFA
jgi:hypothetical protein